MSTDSAIGLGKSGRRVPESNRTGWLQSATPALLTRQIFAFSQHRFTRTFKLERETRLRAFATVVARSCSTN
ncbi:hypothetical protein KCP76_20700 [Salmonella enterica subsp. enterica serovar Weltevreden]|nr:hypothetical protein KCP76_20700 [Salmonella enterica subsp. enterica serovar Weltevreden]